MSRSRGSLPIQTIDELGAVLGELRRRVEKELLILGPGRNHINSDNVCSIERILDQISLETSKVELLQGSREDSSAKEPWWVLGSPVRNQFALVLRHYLAQIGQVCDQPSPSDQLSNLTGFSPSLITAWVTRLDRLPAREDVAVLAWGIAALLDGIQKLPQAATETSQTYGKSGRHELPNILNHLLKARGFSTVDGAADNVIWARLSGNNTWQKDASDPDPQVRRRPPREARIIIGYASNSPLLDPRDGGGPTDMPDGFSAKIAKHVVNSLGFEPTWQALPWNSIYNALSMRDVDLVAPMVLAAPYKFLDCDFSDPLPGLHSGLNCLIPESSLKKLEVEYDFKMEDGKGNLSKPGVLDNLSFVYLEGQVGKWGVPLILPPELENDLDPNQIEEFSQSSSEKDTDIIKSISLDLIARPRDSQQRFRCFISGQLHGYYATGALNSRLPGRMATLFKLDDSVARLKYAFAVSHQEPKLLKAVNLAIRWMIDSGIYREIYIEYKRRLQLAEILDSKYLKEEGIPVDATPESSIDDNALKRKRVPARGRKRK